MRRIFVTAFLCLCAAFLCTTATLLLAAANIKLYLKEGGYQLVREYQVLEDRVKFYSVERSQWEEIPVEMVDLKRTKTEAAAREEKLEKDAKSLTQEEEDRKALRKEISRIPQDPGVYWLDKDDLHIMKAAESTMHTNKGRTALRIITGTKMIDGKATIEIQGEHSQNIFTDPQQEFYIQLSESQAFGIVRVAGGKNVRIVEDLTINGMTNETSEAMNTQEIIIQELAKGGLYKIWAQSPLNVGEYAVVEYTLGKMNIQIWDFAIKAK
jgi:hypothetical protein